MTPRDTVSSRGGTRTSRGRVSSSFTFISCGVKYSLFFSQFFFWLFGCLISGLGVYAALDRYSSGEVFEFDDVYDLLSNIGILLMFLGGLVFLISFMGCIGALRENVCMLKIFSLSLMLFFLLQLIIISIGLLYPARMTDFLEKQFSDKLIREYRDNADFQHIIDQVQKDFECCGFSKKGYKDWELNAYFSCNDTNTSTEWCGVPFSCCIIDEESMLNLHCGFGVRDTKEFTFDKVADVIFTGGCISTIHGLIFNNLYSPVNLAVGVGVGLCQLTMIWMSRTLEQQVQSQKSRW